MNIKCPAFANTFCVIGNATRLLFQSPTMTFKQINRKLLTRLFLLLALIAFVSFVCLFGISEGTIPDNFFTSFMAGLFMVLRFPMHTIFETDSLLWYLLLAFNLLLYSFLIERIVFVVKQRKEHHAKLPIT